MSPPEQDELVAAVMSHLGGKIIQRVRTHQKVRMGQYENKDNSGALFKNDKGDNPKRPDYRGDLTVDGKKYKLSAWLKQGAKGTFMSLSATPDDGQQGGQGERSQPQANEREFASASKYAEPEIPF